MMRKVLALVSLGSFKFEVVTAGGVVITGVAIPGF